ncbi:MAG TPA: 3-hydroxyacyl-CoA dehydrogenase family protein [Chitinophaga sp.]|uniref:3-hydroxyacyl-CoA dehydrogenase family protein n=1 Tax=Chitinophaga sp. TaxID=1869181 RepID=UPI002C77A35C|nr:3-hydroxyacyl-CoA dehydrogenase family protein [Chitinophaga sp.]HVI43702.1 3-hydroxyacyl-CoA dehydrogenase family protein [Chitinophaga sp.]
MKQHPEPENITAGVVGLGLMGSSIAVALLAAGHRVKAVAPQRADWLAAPSRIHDQLLHCEDAGLLHASVEHYLSMLTVTEDYHKLHDCCFVQECVIEKIEIKTKVYGYITAAVGPDVVIASNTSAIPISELQEHIDRPERFLGVHWAEPAHATRFLEITCGKHTDMNTAQWVYQLAQRWGKEPTLLKKDIRGFITNRLMYAVYREAFHLVETGQATMEDADKAFRYDAGSWMTLMGIFRRMDLLGIKDFATAFENIFPFLSNSHAVPVVMQRMAEEQARGVQDKNGLYTYTDDDATQWPAAFAAFTQDINRLAADYPADVLKKQ